MAGNILESIGYKNHLWIGKSFQKPLVFILKLAVLIFSGWYFYVHIIQNVEFWKIFTLSQSILTNSSSIWLFAVCIVMVFMNWGIETLKWQFLLKRFVKISFPKAFAAILSGNAISLWTPNRVGEYVGRMIFLDPLVRVKSIFATLAGSISQLVITLIMGALGFAYYEKTTNLPIIIQLAIGFFALLFICLTLFFYFNIGVIRSWLPGKNWSKGLRKYLLLYKQYKRKELETVLLYSLVRYIVFSVQFYILLVFFGVHIPVIEALMLIFVMYMVQTVSPTTGLTELIVRGSATVYLFHGFTNDIAAVLSASYGIWIINLLIPALSGAIIFGFARINSKLKSA